MDTNTLVSVMDFAHTRLLGSLDAIEKSGEDLATVLAWRPGAGRAHIGWQALHCAATHDKYFNVNIRGQAEPNDPKLVANYGGGSIQADIPLPTLQQIRDVIQANFTALREFVATATPAQLEVVVGPPDRQRKIGESIILLAWHESHHQGQIHLTWNLYKHANGIV